MLDDLIEEVLREQITEGTVLHLGTYNGNPLVMAAVKATLSEACTQPIVEARIARNDRLVDACQLRKQYFVVLVVLQDVRL